MKRRILVAAAALGALALSFGRTDRREAPATAEPIEPVTFARRAVAAAPVAAPVAAAPVTARDPLVDDLYATRACYESQTCDFPRDDPRAYDFAVGRRLAGLLAQVRAVAPPAERQRLAADFMGVEDGFVREQVLLLLADLPPSAENLATLAEGLRLNADPTLVKQALPLLETYLGTDFEAGVHTLLGEMLLGPQLAAVETSLALGRFVNEASFAGYAAALTPLPAGSTIARNVRASLRDFELRQSGG